MIGQFKLDRLGYIFDGQVAGKDITTVFLFAESLTLEIHFGILFDIKIFFRSQIVISHLNVCVQSLCLNGENDFSV